MRTCNMCRMILFAGKKHQQTKFILLGCSEKDHFIVSKSDTWKNFQMFSWMCVKIIPFWLHHSCLPVHHPCLPVHHSCLPVHHSCLPVLVFGSLVQTAVLYTKTYLYNFDPLKPHFYIVKLGFTWGGRRGWGERGIHYFSYFCSKS